MSWQSRATLLVLTCAIFAKCNFTFSYWYGFSSFITYGPKSNPRPTAKTWLYTQMSEILQLFEFFPENNDISVGLGVTILRMNLESIKFFMSKLENQFVGACSACTFQPFNGKEEGTDIDDLLERAERLHTNISNLMLARVPRSYFLRPIAQMFLLNDESWLDNVVDLTLIPDILFDEESAGLFMAAAPDYETYIKVIEDSNFGIPSLNETTYCLRHLGFHVIFHVKFPQVCMVPEDCVRFATEGTNFGWALANRLMLMIFAKFGRNCYYISVEDDRLVVAELCGWARMNLDMLVYGKYELASLIFEFITYCNLFGHRNMIDIMWLYHIKNFYYPKNLKVNGKSVGCVTSAKKSPAPDLEKLFRGKKSWWELAKFDNDQLGTCNRHSTAMYLATLAGAFRATFQPAYCPYKKGIIPNPDFCFVPRKLSEPVLNKYIAYNENRYNYYEVLGDKKICIPFSNSSCGPFVMNETYYEGLDFRTRRNFTNKN